MREPKKIRKDGDRQVEKKVDFIQQLIEFEKFKEEILPMLMEDIQKGTPPAEMRKKYQTYLAARQISVALTTPDPSIALQAIKDLSDRNEGRAVERRESTHKFENLPDDQLDAALNSQITELEDILN